MTTQLSPEQGASPTETVTATSPKSGHEGRVKKARLERPNFRPLPIVIQGIPFLAEILIVAAGSLVLWWGAQGNGVINANQASITVFIASLTALMTGRGFILVMLSSSTAPPHAAPSGTRWLITARNIALVMVALYSRYFGDYIGQWIITFAAITLAATSLAGLMIASIGRESSNVLTQGCFNASAGVLALAFTYDIHHWDQTFLSILTSLTLVPAFVAWSLTKTLSNN